MKRPTELDDHARQGISFKRDAAGVWQEQRGEVRCARCDMVPSHLYGHSGAPLCEPCIMSIAFVWSELRIAERQRELGLVVEAPVLVPWYDRPVPAGWDLLVMHLFSVLLGMWWAAIEIGRALP